MNASELCRLGSKHIAALGLACVLTACISGGKKCEWMFDEANVCFSDKKISRLYLEPEDLFSQPGIELAMGNYGLRGYLNIYSIPLKSSCDDRSSIAIVVKTSAQDYQEEGFLFQGGQRILLTEMLTKVICSELMEGRDVAIQAGKYRTMVKSDGFKKYYQRA